MSPPLLGRGYPWEAGGTVGEEHTVRETLDHAWLGKTASQLHKVYTDIFSVVPGRGMAGLGCFCG